MDSKFMSKHWPRSYEGILSYIPHLVRKACDTKSKTWTNRAIDMYVKSVDVMMDEAVIAGEFDEEPDYGPARNISVVTYAAIQSMGKSCVDLFSSVDRSDFSLSSIRKHSGAFME